MNPFGYAVNVYTQVTAGSAEAGAGSATASRVTAAAMVRRMGTPRSARCPCDCRRRASTADTAGTYSPLEVHLMWCGHTVGGVLPAQRYAPPPGKSVAPAGGVISVVKC
ncbi:hypothetical protein Cs7R123_51790 [Catellatospora sp. TT07R-123]|nr:hypothetical protein Cs7R123_51790 [Catellatospora sp. TT07R-123]